MKRLKTLILVIVVAAVCVGCDQATKKIAKNKLSNAPVYSFFHDTVRLLYVENTGSFLGLGWDLPENTGFWSFIAMPLVMLAVILVYILISKKLSLIVTVSFSLIIGGGIGNLIDRISNNRHVADFINVGIGRLRTGIFNFADFFILTGIIILLLTSLFEEKSGKKA